ncbi:MAG: hypothetical protein QM731_14200 [Chitinophagaceae bacterium]
MNKLPTSWKVFRTGCIVQMVLVALQFVFTVNWIFRTTFVITALLEAIAYVLIFVFLYKGLSLLNDNYPDIPLTVKQKKQFNWLFIINLLLIAFLFAEIIAEWRATVPLLMLLNAGFGLYFLIGYPLFLVTLIFLFHLIFLVGMAKLRGEIHTNAMNDWDKLGEENSPGIFKE